MEFPKLTEVNTLEPYILFLRYDDGTYGKVDLSDMKGKGIFKWWDSKDNFKKGSFDKEIEAIMWSNKIDSDPSALYLKLKKLSFDDWKSLQISHAQTI
ncbi:MAG: hypothetical protein ACRDE2_00600 [Chitinophagaceae bacterium]